MDAKIAELALRTLLSEEQLDLLNRIEAVYSGRVRTWDGPVADGDWLVGQLALELDDSTATRKLIENLRAEGRRREPEALERLRREQETPLHGPPLISPPARWELAIDLGEGPQPICDECGREMGLNMDGTHARDCPYRPATIRQGVKASAPPEPRLVASLRPGPPPLIDESGVRHNYVSGVGYQPTTHMDIPVHDTTISGLPRQDPSPGRQPTRTLAGTPITGRGGQPLYKRPFG